MLPEREHTNKSMGVETWRTIFKAMMFSSSCPSLALIKCCFLSQYPCPLTLHSTRGLLQSFQPILFTILTTSVAFFVSQPHRLWHMLLVWFLWIHYFSLGKILEDLSKHIVTMICGYTIRQRQEIYAQNRCIINICCLKEEMISAEDQLTPLFCIMRDNTRCFSAKYSLA